MAEGFPVTSRSEGIGLEISFADMALASRCLSLVEFDEGLLAHGLTSMLIPMSELTKDDALQWHFESKTRPGKALAKISQILKTRRIAQWHRELSPELLFNRRCFLGWTESAVITMGTADYQREFEWSGAKRIPSVTVSKSYSLTFGTSGMGFVTAEGTRHTLRTAMQTSIQSDLRNDVHDALAAGREHLVLLYDTEAKTAYYLPKATVVLQMVHSIIHSREYKVYAGDQLVSPDFTSYLAEPGPDGYLGAQRALREFLKLRVYKGIDAQGDVVEDATVLISKSWHTLDEIGMRLDEAKPRFEEAGFATPQYVHGMEWNDAMNMERSKPIYRCRVNQPWTHITHEHSIVLFTKKLQPPVAPTCDNLCESWSTIPSKQNYLAMMGLTVRSLLRRHNDGLAEKVEWLRGRRLITSHGGFQGSAIQHAQKLRSVRTASSNKQLRTLVEPHVHGCFVFGDGTERKCSREARPPDPQRSEWEVHGAATTPQSRATHTIPSGYSDSPISPVDSSSDSSNLSSVETRGGSFSPPGAEASSTGPELTATELIEQPNAQHPQSVQLTPDTGPVRLPMVSICSQEMHIAQTSAAQSFPHYCEEVFELRETSQGTSMERSGHPTCAASERSKQSRFIRSMAERSMSFLARPKSSSRQKGKGKQARSFTWS